MLENNMKYLDYKIVENYRDDLNLIVEYQKFISEVFPSISFKEWYNKGFWIERYIPFSLIKNEKIISNVSVSIMNILLSRREYIAAQFGAVGTLPENRNQGLSRYLMNYVIEKLKNEVSFFFLFANDTVMDFYPKFGFRNIEENLFALETNLSNDQYSARKLNINNEKDYSLIQNLIKRRKPITKLFGAENYESITMWHILNTYYNDLYYLDEEDIIFIKTEKDGILDIWEVIYTKEFHFKKILKKIITSNSIQRIIYHFPPDQLKYKYSKSMIEYSRLFIRGEIFKNKMLIKFPETAHT